MRNVIWGKGTYGMMRYMRRVANGVYQLNWQGSAVAIIRLKQGPYKWVVKVDDVTKLYTETLNQAMFWVDNVWGNEPVETYNLLNKQAGPLKIARKNRGGCCDPGTETYWSM